MFNKTAQKNMKKASFGVNQPFLKHFFEKKGSILKLTQTFYKAYLHFLI